MPLNNQPWLNRSKTLCEEQPPHSYLDILDSQLSYLFPDFVRNLRAQTVRERNMSRAAVIDYGDESHKQTTYKSSEELQQYFSHSATDDPASARRRLFLLEDLSRDYVEIIGSQLSIPPAFFGSHWADPTHPNFNYRSPFHRYSKENYMIRYASTLPVRIDASADTHGTIYRYDTNVNRHINCYDPKSPIIDQPKGYHVLSFWTSGVRHDGSWDSILLIDPPIREHVVSLTDGSLLKADHHSTEHAYTRMRGLEPDLNEARTLSSGTQDKHSQADIYPKYASMFEDILSVTAALPAVTTVDPRSCTEPARKLVISVFLTYLRRRILNMIRLQANPRVAVLTVNRCDYLRNFGQGALSSWHHELFGFIVNVKFIMGLMAKEVDDNIVALGLYRSNTITTTTTTYTTTPSVRPLSSAPPCVAADAPQWELDGWISIQEDCSKMTAMAEAFLQSYLAFTSMQEAQSANRNASSLARITNLTMVFIPLSAIAAIFSMTDEYLPGREKSWIFWVTAAPVLVLTFVLTLEFKGRWAERVGMGRWRWGRRREELDGDRAV